LKLGEFLIKFTTNVSEPVVLLNWLWIPKMHPIKFK